VLGRQCDSALARDLAHRHIHCASLLAQPLEHALDVHRRLPTQHKRLLLLLLLLLMLLVVVACQQALQPRHACQRLHLHAGV
jgi:hypothetical protein